MYNTFIKPTGKIIKYLFRDYRKKIPLDEKVKLNFKEKKLLHNLKIHGYAVIENFASEEICEHIIKKIDYIFENYPAKIWKDDQKSDNRIFGAQIADKKIMEYFNDNFIKKIGEAYLGFKIKNAMSMANRVTFSSNNNGSGNGWHKDAYRKQFKSMLYLNNVDKNNGPFQLLKRSNKIFNLIKVVIKLQKTYPDTRFSENEIEKISRSEDVITLDGRRGTLILFDPSLTHRGSPLKSSRRYALTNYYESLHNFDAHRDNFKPKFDLE